MKRAFLDQPPAARIWVALLTVAIAAYICSSFIVGGDAWHGRISAGQFFVAHHTGAPEHEVSWAAFHFSLWSFRSVVCLWLIGMVVGLYALMKPKA